MGNPHCVYFVKDAGPRRWRRSGAETETDPIFPKANVEFVQVLAEDRMRMRVWERGAGVTLACGLQRLRRGVAGGRARADRATVTIELDGGEIADRLAQDGVHMAGPVSYVFEGALDPRFAQGMA
jgi:diaminopimelate epimerase